MAATQPGVGGPSPAVTGDSEGGAAVPDRRNSAVAGVGFFRGSRVPSSSERSRPPVLLDLFAAIADADLAQAPEPEDRVALDARWQVLHQKLAHRFAPFSTWRVEPDPVARQLDAGS